MIRNGRLFSWLFAVAVLPVLAGASAQADTITTLHMDINCITISAVDSLGNAGFSGLGFSGTLNLSSNTLTNLNKMDIDGNNSIGYTGHITGFTGGLDLVGGVLTGGSVTVDVATGSGTSTLTDSYTYDVVGNSGHIAGSSKPSTLFALGYSLIGNTDDGAFANPDFGGVNVQTWYDEQIPPGLLGNFTQMYYHPNSNGTDLKGDLELYVNAETSSNGSPFVPLPSSLLGGLMGMGLLGAYGWRRSAQMKNT